MTTSSSTLPLPEARASDPYRLPPGPKGKWGPTLAIVRNPRTAFATWKKQYGDPFLVSALNGPIVVTGRPDLIKQVFSEDPSTFGVFGAGTIVPVLGSGSLLLMHGSDHKRERKLMSPMFHGERMKSYGQSMQRIALDHIRSRETAGIFETLSMMVSVSIEVIVQSIFGGNEGADRRRLMAAGSEVVKRSHPLLFFSKRTHFSLVGLSWWDRFRQARQKLFDGFDSVIDRVEQNEAAGEDILSMLVGARYEDGSPITREHIREELMTFLFAGHETSALAMTWAIYHIHSHEQVRERLRAELDALDGCDPAQLASLPYLKAVIQESLRLHPIVTEVLRFLVKPMHLGEFHLPPGTGIAPAAVMAHYDPELYSDPESFRPERFLERNYMPFEFLPFGGGHRRCIGAAFAMYEMAIVLGTMLKHYDFTLHETKPVVSVRRSVTFGPSSPIRASIKPRSNA